MIRLYDLRSESELSQREIARQLHISQSTYHNWESGKTQPSIAQLIDLAEFFGVSVDYLIGNSDDCGIITYSENHNEKIIKRDEYELLRLYRSLPEAARKNILDFIKNISSNI